MAALIAISDINLYNAVSTHRGAHHSKMNDAEIKACFGTRKPEPDNAGVGIESGYLQVTQANLKPVPLKQESEP